MKKVEEYRLRAIEAEKLAETAPTDHDRRNYLQLAFAYRALAERREGLILSGKARPAPKAPL